MKRLLFFLTIVAALCSMNSLYKYPDEVNKRLISRLEKKYIKQNGNCFYITSTYSPLAVIWHYEDSLIHIHYLNSGRIKQTKQFGSYGLSVIDTLNIDPLIFYEDGWDYALDGDGLHCSIQNRKYEFDLSIDLSSSLKNSSKTLLSKFIKGEISKYNLW